jgi:hypothetical protein
MPTRTISGLLLSEGQADFLQSGISINIAGRGADNSLSVSRAYGCLVSQDRRMVTVYGFSGQSEQLLKHIAESGVIAVVFSKPSTHETLQLKSASARQCPVSELGLEAMVAYRRAFLDELLGLGYASSFAQAMVPQSAGDPVGICFSPQLVFSQTPGPNAGAKLTP